MKRNFDAIYRHLSTPIIFKAEFNQGQAINITQAWSLFFTAGCDVDDLGTEPELGKFFTYLLIGIVVTGAVGSLIYFQGA